VITVCEAMTRSVEEAGIRVKSDRPRTGAPAGRPTPRWIPPTLHWHSFGQPDTLM